MTSKLTWWGAPKLVWRRRVKHWNWSDLQHLSWFCPHPFYHRFMTTRLMPWAFLFGSVLTMLGCLAHTWHMLLYNSGSRPVWGDLHFCVVRHRQLSRAISGVIFLSETHYVSDRPVSAPGELLSRHWIRVHSENSAVLKIHIQVCACYNMSGSTFAAQDTSVIQQRTEWPFKKVHAYLSAKITPMKPCLHIHCRSLQCDALLNPAGLFYILAWGRRQVYVLQAFKTRPLTEGGHYWKSRWQKVNKG